MEDLKNLSKEELINKCRNYIGISQHQHIVIVTRTSQIRHFRKRLEKLRNSIDYLLKYPFSVDNSMKTKKHDRDIQRKPKEQI